MYGKDGTVVTDAEEMALTTLLGEVCLKRHLATDIRNISMTNEAPTLP